MNQSTHTDAPLTIEQLRAQQAAAAGPIEGEIVSEGGASTEIMVMATANAELILLRPEKREQLYSHIRKEIEDFVPDLTTDTGRKAIASLARKVVNWKTFIGDAKAELKAEWIKKSREVDTEWRTVETELNALRDQARKPLTDWEEAEERRKSICQATITRLNSAAVVGIDATVESVHALLADLRIITTDEESMQEYSTMATEAKSLAIKSLSTALTRLEKEEADRAELAKLRAENEKRIIEEMQAAAHEEEERLKREEAERQRVAEEKRIADEQARIQQAAKDAEEKARQEAEKIAREAAEKQQRDHDAEIARLKADQDKKDADARRERDEAAAKHDAEMDRIAKEAADRKAEEVRLKKIADDKTAEDEKLAKNKKHRGEVMTTAKLALIKHCGIDEDRARAVVRMIVDGKIPAVTLSFTS